MPRGGVEKKITEREEITKIERYSEVPGFARSVARGWCDIKNLLDFRVLAGFTEKFVVYDSSIVAQHGRINTTMDRFSVPGRFQGVSLGTIRQPALVIAH